MEYVLRTERFSSIAHAIENTSHELHIPALCDIEFAAALRRGLLSGTVEDRRAGDAIGDYLDLPLTRHGHQALIGRIFVLRDNFTAYDAVYVALAERLRGDLLTTDERLARAARSHTSISLLSS